MSILLIKAYLIWFLAGIAPLIAAVIFFSTTKKEIPAWAENIFWVWAAGGIFGGVLMAIYIAVQTVLFLS